jgi:hypothetical protein
MSVKFLNCIGNLSKIDKKYVQDSKIDENHEVSAQL